MSGGGKGGSQTSQVKVPKYIEDATKQNLATAQRIAQLDYMPYYGPDVAAATPQQQASWQMANQASSAFGMPTADISLPQAQDFGGIQGYSGGGIYDLALQELQRRNPQQYAARQNLFGSPQAQQQQAQQPASNQNTIQTGNGAMTLDPATGRLSRERNMWGGNR